GLGNVDCRCRSPCGAHLCHGNEADRGRGAGTHPRDVRRGNGCTDRSRPHRRDQLKRSEAVMPVNILMPALSPTMEKGNLAKWLKKEGDRVKPGDVIAETETDKARMEYEAIEEGTLAKIVVPEGTQDAPVNQLIAVLAEEGEDVKTAAATAAKRA